MTEQLSPCFHCGESIPKGIKITAQIDQQERLFCCHGCEAVARVINGAGLENYYQFRTENAPRIDQDPERLAKYSVYDEPTVQQQFCREEDGKHQATLLISGISCAACVWLIEKHLENIPGMEDVRVNLTTHRATLEWDKEQLKASEIFIALEHIGYQAEPWKANKAEQLLQKENHTALIRLGIAGIGAMQVMMMATSLYFGHYTGIDSSYESFIRWASLFLSTPVVIYSAFPFFNAAIRDLKTRHLTMDVPVSIAIILAYIASIWATFTNTGEVYFDSVCMFTFFLLLGRFFEMKARHINAQAGNQLIGLLPNTSWVMKDGEYTLTPTEQLQVGDQVLVKPGQTVPSDATVIEGSANIDESALTGEYLPVHKEIGSAVLGGTLCLDHPLTLEITNTGHKNTLNLVIELMNKAETVKPKAARIADAVASKFVAAVLITAGSVWGFWMMYEPENAFWIALSVLVVTCPCALSLATPTAITSATAALKKAGLVITNPETLEALPQTTDILFDKTGTLTEGKLCIAEVSAQGQAKNLTDDQLLDLAAQLESVSEHPVARAFPAAKAQASEVEITTGGGLSGILHPDIVGTHTDIDFSQRFYIGHTEFINQQTQLDLKTPDAEHWIGLASAKGLIGWFKIQDTLREDATLAVSHLNQLANTHMLTGDRSLAAQQIATEVNIGNIQSGLTPDAKLHYLEKLQADNKKTLMIGDGINDIPVLASANVSIAMGEATDLAKTKSDMILMNGQLESVSKAFAIAQKCRRIIKQNLTWSLTYNIIALPLAAAGYIPPWAAAIGMSTSSLIVVLNAVRLRAMA